MARAKQDIEFIVCYEPDREREVQALLIMLRDRKAQPPAHEGTAEESEIETTSQSAPAVGTTGASTETGTVTSSATSKQGSPHDTTPHH